MLSQLCHYVITRFYNVMYYAAMMFLFFFLWSRTSLVYTWGWTQDFFICNLCMNVHVHCAVAEILSGEGLCDRAVQPSPYHSGLSDYTPDLSQSHPSPGEHRHLRALGTNHPLLLGS